MSEAGLSDDGNWARLQRSGVFALIVGAAITGSTIYLDTRMSDRSLRNLRSRHEQTCVLLRTLGRDEDAKKAADEACAAARL